ncbi:acyl carrier protein [Variovorax paradoxus]|nr:acyl carrier protein [Variovorax paradoxus]
MDDVSSGTTRSLQELQALILELYGSEAAALDRHAPLRDKGFDSLTLIEFVFAIEDRFSISIADDETNSVDTLAGLAALVDDKLRMTQAK